MLSVCSQSAQMRYLLLWKNYQVAVLQLHELLCTHVLVHVVVVGKYALAIHDALRDISIFFLNFCPSAITYLSRALTHSRSHFVDWSCTSWHPDCSNTLVSQKESGTDGMCEGRTDVLAKTLAGAKCWWLVAGTPNKARRLLLRVCHSSSASSYTFC